MNFAIRGTFGAGSVVTDPETGAVYSLEGKAGSDAILTASADDRELNGSPRDEAMIYDLTLGGNNALRLSGFDVFRLRAGDDVLDLTVRPENADQPYQRDVTASGGDGDDILWTGDGWDFVYGDGVRLTVEPGEDTIDGGAGNDLLWGDAEDLLDRDGADDIVRGGDGSDFLRGDGSSMPSGQGGNDLLEGGDDDDDLIGDAYELFEGVGGDDALYGDAGADEIKGDARQFQGVAGDDNIYGGAGNDYIHGDAEFGGRAAVGGDDRIEGGTGNDWMWGDVDRRVDGFTSGSDTFVFAPGDGDDRILDFSTGKDVIDLTAWSFGGLEDLDMSGNGTGEVTIALDADDRVQVDVISNDMTLTEDNFLFV
ncbi:calcium-binding protein [Marinivivus vitaminiproducens]|uniref:calcium-binding protein n=1 Tax=Marinivivus vitaminiproducens TaxID=3035935 RepID=UPI00279A94A5|nr:hypothetical protein P4R82_01040 [Geminicoccaceae bacterium SCSIO 64248]